MVDFPVRQVTETSARVSFPCEQGHAVILLSLCPTSQDILLETHYHLNIRHEENGETGLFIFGFTKKCVTSQ